MNIKINFYFNLVKTMLLRKDFVMLAVFFLWLVVPSIGQSTFTDDVQLVAISDMTTAIPIEGTELMCIALGGNITWMKDGSEHEGSDDYSVEIIDKIFDYGGRMYQLSFLKFCNPLNEIIEGNYTCIVSDENNETIIKDTRLQIKREYVTVTSSEGNMNITLNCSAHGFEDTILSFTWAPENKEHSPVMTSIFNIPYLQCSEFEKYTCIANSSSAYAMQTIILPPNKYIQILKITEAATPVGGKGTLLCSGTSLRNRDLNVTWTNMNGRVLQSNDTMNDGVITSSLTFSNVTETQFGLYTCTLTDGLCSVNSTTILDTADVSVQQVILSGNTTGYEGGSAVLICDSYTMPQTVNTTVTWKRKDTLISNLALADCQITEDEYHSNGNMFKRSSLHLCNLTFSDAGSYTCVITSKTSSRNSSLSLSIFSGDTVLSVKINNTSENCSEETFLVYPGDSLVLKCEGLGGPRTHMSIEWMQDDQELPASSYTTDEQESEHDGTRIISSKLTHSPAENARYTCIVNSGNSSLESNVTVTIGPDYNDIELAIISEDAITDLDLGVMFTCVAFANKNSTKLNISWIRNRDNMILNTEAQYCIIEREFIQGNYRFKQTFLQIKLLACNNAGTYTCSVTDGGSVAVQHTVNLYLRSSVEIVASSKAVYAKVGGDARLVCIAHSSNNDYLDFTWSSQGVVISGADNITIINHEQFNQSDRLYVMSVLHRCNDSVPLSIRDNSVFECSAAGKCESSSNIELIVQENPQLFQLKIHLQSKHCAYYKNDVDVMAFTRIFRDTLRFRCDCGLDNQEIISNATLLCPTDLPGYILYRAQLGGTKTISIDSLTQTLEKWVESNPAFGVNGHLLNIDSSCPLFISSFGDPPCTDLSTTEPPPTTPLKIEIISGIVLTIFFLVGLIMAIMTAFLLRRKAAKVKTSAIYNYVDNYQYRMYYKAEGLYEELNDYEPIDGAVEKFKLAPCDAYNKMYKKNLPGQYSHYEPTGGDIYGISTCAAYTAGQGNLTAIHANIYENIADLPSDECSQKSDKESNSDNKSYEVVRGGSLSSPTPSQAGMQLSETECIMAETDGL